MKKSIFITVLLIMCLVLTSCGTTEQSGGGQGAQGGQSGTKDEMSGEVIIGSHEVGTSGYQYVAYIIEGISSKFDALKVKALPSGTESTRAYYARLGDADCFVTGGLTPYYLQEGINGFDTMNWGPQEVAGVFFAPHNGYGFGVQDKSDIKTISDLKGKKVAITPASPSTYTNVVTFLAFANLKLDDVVLFEVASSALGYEALADGTVDACFFNPTSAKAYELVSSAAGLRFLEFPADDKEGWARANAVSPIEVPKLTYKGAGIDPQKPLQLMSSPYPEIVAWMNADEDKIYKLTKAIWEARDGWAAMDETMSSEFTKDMHWTLFDNSNIPMHPGAVKYYKEVGEWTDAREAANNERLSHQKELKTAWKDALDKATSEKVKEADFAEFWLKQRKSAGFDSAER